MQGDLTVSLGTGAAIAGALGWVLRLEYKLGRIEANIETLTRRIAEFGRVIEGRYGWKE